MRSARLWMRLGQLRVPGEQQLGLLRDQLQRVEDEDAGGVAEVLDFL